MVTSSLCEPLNKTDFSVRANYFSVGRWTETRSYKFWLLDCVTSKVYVNI